MSYNTVLLAIEPSGRHRLVRILTAMKYSIVTVDSLERALSKIQHLNFTAAVLKGNNELDPLEFVLNARELDETMPIIVIANDPDTGMVEALTDRRHVWVIDSPDEDLAGEMSRVLRKISG